jgi:hypothetical protein
MGPSANTADKGNKNRKTVFPTKRDEGDAKKAPQNNSLTFQVLLLFHSPIFPECTPIRIDQAIMGLGDNRLLYHRENISLMGSCCTSHFTE